MDQRRDHLAQWAIATLEQQNALQSSPQLSKPQSSTSRSSTSQSSLQVSMVSGDASFRRYFRLSQMPASEIQNTQPQASWIAVDAPADKEDNPRFVRIARHWHRQGVAVPEVLAHDFEHGFMLLEDFGDQLLWPALHQENGSESEQAQRVKNLYRQAIDQLLALQQLNGEGLPDYDAALLDQEMALFSDWLCQHELQLELSADEQQMLDQVFSRLRDSALAQPQYVVHRDFHSRNLMLRANDELGVIDFQDAVIGAASYDLVSLLRDCYVRWPDEWIDELSQYYWDKAQGLNLYSGDYQQFQRDFDWMGMQRHLKAAGIFARLARRDGKTGYLADIANTCQYLLEISARYVEFSDFQQWLQQRFLPALNLKAQSAEYQRAG